MRETLILLFAVCSFALFVAWFVYLPIFMRLLAKVSPDEYQRLGDMTFFPSSRTFPLCMYFLRREYLATGVDEVVFHGNALRWSFSIAAIVAFAIGAILLAMEHWAG